MVDVTCITNSTLGLVKQLLWEKSMEMGYQLDAMPRYSMKVSHTHVYLTGDNTPLYPTNFSCVFATSPLPNLLPSYQPLTATSRYDFPIIQFCWKKQLIPHLSLVEKQESKQVKVLSLFLKILMFICAVINRSYIISTYQDKLVSLQIGSLVCRTL